MLVERLDTYAGHRDCIYALSEAAEPHRFFSAGGDGLVIRWDFTKPDLGEPIAQLPASVYALTRDPATELLWVGQNYDGIHWIDPREKREISSLKITGAAIFDIALTDTHGLVALGDGTVVVMSKADFSPIKHLGISKVSARCIALNLAQNEFAVGCSDGYISVLSLDTFVLKNRFLAHQNSVFCLKYIGNLLVSGSRDARIKAWDSTQNYAQVQEVVAHTFAINHIALSPDTRFLATASMDKSIKIWDTTTFRLLKVLDKARYAGHGTSVNKLLWTQDLLVSGSDDRRLALWKITEEAHQFPQ